MLQVSILSFHVLEEGQSKHRFSCECFVYTDSTVGHFGA
jgi:hypothetical protein